MGTKLWGPDTWYVIHVIADSAPDKLNRQEQEDYKKFYKSLANVLPCPSCSEHYKKFLKHDPPRFKTRYEMLQWTIRAHNNANRNTGATVLNEEQAMTRIEQEIQAREQGNIRGRLPTFFERCYDSSLSVSIILGLLLFGYYMFRRSE